MNTCMLLRHRVCFIGKNVLHSDLQMHLRLYNTFLAGTDRRQAVSYDGLTKSSLVSKKFEPPGVFLCIL